MSERFSRGLRIAGASWRVLNEDRKLLALPLMSFAGIAMVTLPFLASDEMPDFQSEPTVRQWILIGCYYFLGNAIAAFFNAALISAALARLDGGAPTLGDALHAAWQRVHRIVAWALVGAVVGVILTEIESRLGFVGRLVGRLLGTAWGVLTFFVIPVLVIEDAGVFTAIGRSKDLFRKRWGEQLVGDGAIGLIFGLIALIPIAFGVAVAIATSAIAGIVVGGLGVVAVMSVESAVAGIFTAAVYRYASTGELLEPYRPADLHMAFTDR